MIEKTRLPSPEPVDVGTSAAPERRCKTCACYIEFKNPRAVGQSQGLCRRNGVMMMMQPGNGIGLAYPPTQQDLVCFDGWRPADTPPGQNVLYAIPPLR
jgi:hypothetical protein